MCMHSQIPYLICCASLSIRPQEQQVCTWMHTYIYAYNAYIRHICSMWSAGMYIYTYIHAYIHTYRHQHCWSHGQELARHQWLRRHIHTYIYTYIHTHVHTCRRKYIHTYIHTYIHACIHTYIHTYIHMYIHTGANIGGVVLKKLPEGSGFASFEVNVRSREEIDKVMSQLKVTYLWLSLFFISIGFHAWRNEKIEKNAFERHSYVFQTPLHVHCVEVLGHA